jgi:phosphoribosylamine--glycine ligase
VVEFNVRFGDPETQPLLMQMQSDLLPLLDASARGGLDRLPPPTASGAAVCVVLASGGYPRGFKKGFPITGLDAAARDPNVVVFHAGTKKQDGVFVTAGGRVLGVTARGNDVAEAQRRAYAAVDELRFEGAQLRRDIASRAVTSS